MTIARGKAKLVWIAALILLLGCALVIWRLNEHKMLEYDQLTELKYKPDVIQQVRIVNGTSTMSVKLAGNPDYLDVIIPDGERKSLIQRWSDQGVCLDVRETFEWPSVFGGQQESLTYTVLRGWLKEDHIQTVRILDGSRVEMRQVGSAKWWVVTYPTEMKHDLFDAIIKKAVTVVPREKALEFANKT